MTVVKLINKGIEDAAILEKLVDDYFKEGDYVEIENKYLIIQIKESTKTESLSL